MTPVTTLYMDKGYLVYEYNVMIIEQTIRDRPPLPMGEVTSLSQTGKICANQIHIEVYHGT